MKSSWLIFVFLFLIRACTNSPDLINNEIVVSPTSVIFDEKNDSSKNKVIEITNNGKNRLYIHPIEVPCPCITVDFDNNIIKPGEKGIISISYTGSYNNPSIYSIYFKIGAFGKKESENIFLLSVRIKPNSPQEKSHQHILQIIPSSIDFGKTDSDCVKSQFSIINAGDRSIIIEEIETSCVCITTDFDNNNNQLLAGEKRDIQVYYNSHGSIKPARFSVYIKTNYSSRPYIVNIFANQ